MTKFGSPTEILLSSVCLGLLSKIIWDWLKSGRVEVGTYLTKKEFIEHCKACGTTALASRVNICQNEAIKMESRLSYAEANLIDGKESFKSIQKDISDIKLCMTRIAGALENKISHMPNIGDPM